MEGTSSICLARVNPGRILRGEDPLPVLPLTVKKRVWQKASGGLPTDREAVTRHDQRRYRRSHLQELRELAENVADLLGSEVEDLAAEVAEVLRGGGSSSSVGMAARPPTPNTWRPSTWSDSTRRGSLSRLWPSPPILPC